MSLTSFLNVKEVREKFREEFPKLFNFRVKTPLLAPPLTKNYQLVGTAFDYLLRFYIKRLNPNAIESSWVAENSLRRIKAELKYLKKRNSPDDKISRPLLEYWCKGGEKIVSKAKKDYATFLRSGKLGDDIMRSTLLLSKLDFIKRAGYVKGDLEVIDEDDIADLKNLFTVVNPEFFELNKTCILNPTFGEGSILVRGADADLVIGDALIEIKTTKHLQFNQKHFNQLIGYYILYKIGGIDKMREENEIKKLGIYFSRHGYLHLLNIKDVIEEEKLLGFIKWFKQRAKQEYK